MSRLMSSQLPIKAEPHERSKHIDALSTSLRIMDISENPITGQQRRSRRKMRFRNISLHYRVQDERRAAWDAADQG